MIEEFQLWWDLISGVFGYWTRCWEHSRKLDIALALKKINILFISLLFLVLTACQILYVNKFIWSSQVYAIGIIFISKVKKWRWRELKKCVQGCTTHKSKMGLWTDPRGSGTHILTTYNMYCFFVEEQMCKLRRELNCFRCVINICKRHNGGIYTQFYSEGMENQTS